MERIRRERARRAEEYYASFTFEPEINRVSQLLGRPSTTNELVREGRRAGPGVLGLF
jgi:hypothetical protein